MSKRSHDIKQEDVDNKKVMLSTSKINEYDANGLTPLHRAVLNNNVLEVSNILLAGADINAVIKNEEDYWDASQNMHIKCRGDNVAHLAMQNGLLNMTTFFAARDIKLFEARNAIWQTPLGSAAAGGKLNTAKFFLDCVEPRIQTLQAEGDCTLAPALYNKHYDIVKILLERGANPNFSMDNSYGPGSAMYFAGQSNGINTMKLVWQYGADINGTGFDLDTALRDNVDVSTYCEEEKEEEVKERIEFLLQHGAGLDIPNSRGQTVLDIVMTGDHDVCYSVKKMVKRALEIDLICGEDIEGYDLEDMKKLPKVEYVNHNTEFNNLSRINHKILHRGKMSLKQIVDNARHIQNKVTESGNALGLNFDNIKGYISSLIQDVNAFSQQSGIEEGVPTLFKLSLDTIRSSEAGRAKWEELKTEYADYEAAKARTLMCSSYLESAAKQNALQAYRPKLNEEIATKSNLLNNISDLLQYMSVQLVSDIKLTEQPMAEVTVAGDSEVLNHAGQLHEI